MKYKLTTTKLDLIAFSLALFTLLVPSAHAGKIKCWTNKDGVKECGQYVPPEYSQKRIETRSSKGGHIVEVEERAKTKQELEHEAALEAEKKRLEDIEAEKKRQDEILLKTFTNIRDIDILRDNKLNVIEGMIGVTRGNNKVLENKLEKLQKEAANLERGGKQPPATLLQDIQDLERQIKNNNAIIAKHRQDQQVIRDEYEGYKKRYLKLKGLSDPGAQSKADTSPVTTK